MLKGSTTKLQVIADTDEFRQVRKRRLMQICSAILIGLLSTVIVAKGITLLIFGSGILSILISFMFAFKGKRIISAYLLMWSMAIMLSMLAITGACLFDLAILGYP
jgi:hypothetical protein